ncbi:endosome/lysosome-associated apoptosis and autophagy regulator family member 2-like [Lampetra planeri]
MWTKQAASTCCGLKRGLFVGAFLLTSRLLLASAQSVCSPVDYHFEYTECDSTNSRWRVAIPNIPGSCLGFPEPTQGKECSFSCGSGEFLNIPTETCIKCTPGTYSLGSGVRFDEWDALPTGFLAASSSQTVNPQSDVNSCNQSLWTPKDQYIESNRDDCSASLIYRVNLKTEGTIAFEYQYTDSNMFFEFFVQNDQCQMTDFKGNVKYMPISETGKWVSHEVKLPKGSNVLYWRTTGMVMHKDNEDPKPVRMRSIHITGISYTSKCFPCKAGTFSQDEGASSCQLCPKNTYAAKGSYMCSFCERDYYSDPGSSDCKPKEPCTADDYIFTHSACDEEGQTQLQYSWVEPMVCREDLEGAVSLPQPGKKQQCAPCNPGHFSSDGSKCLPCPQGTFSNGTTECSQCPAGTEPVLGLEYKWWSSLPQGMKSSCFNVDNTNCDQMKGWLMAQDHIVTGTGASDNDYLILSLSVPGYSYQTKNDSKSIEVSRVTFAFELDCVSQCELFFMVDTNRKATRVKNSWQGNQEKQVYTYIVPENFTTTFTWAFQRSSNPKAGREFVTDIAKIYAINVTNALSSVSSHCRPCAQGGGSGDADCVPCPAGFYITEDSWRACVECPDNTVVADRHALGRDSCQPCGPAARSNPSHSACYSDCTFTYETESGVLEFNYGGLNGTTSKVTGPSFTAKGTMYNLVYNISLCGNEGAMKAQCVDNVTNAQLSQKDQSQRTQMEAFVCRSTIITSEARGIGATVSSQILNLADRFIGARTETTLDGINVPLELFPPSDYPSIPDIIHYYRSSDTTNSCPDGRVTTFRLRCSPESGQIDDIAVPSKCPEGTCDGCTFHFLWTTPKVCPLCREVDYKKVTESCQGGTERTRYEWKAPGRCTGGVSLPPETRNVCMDLSLWLKVGIGGSILVAVALVFLTCLFWKKNKKLEYKYSSLLMNGSVKDGGELPAVDSCAIMEGEEEDVIFAKKKSKSFFGKLMNKKKDPEEVEFQSVQLQLKS